MREKENFTTIDVSIVVPVLNVRQYIERCLDSLVNQTLTNIEIICVDGGSTDGTLDILTKYQNEDSRIVIIDSPIKSYGYQMNVGIQNAKGTYIGIVEPDDFVEKHMFCEMLNKTRYIGEVDFVKGGYFEYSDDFRECSYQMNTVISEEYYDRVLDLNCNFDLRLIDINHIWSAIYKRSFLIDSNIRFNETKGASFQDTGFSILTGFLANKCIYTKDSFYYYRIDNPNSSVKSDSKISCVVDEIKYVESELIKRKQWNINNIRALQKKKLQIYRWNLLRLGDKGRETFLEIIKDEMAQYSDELINKEMNREEVTSYRILTSKYELYNYEQKTIEARKCLKKICDLLVNKESCVLVGCGSLGMKILCMQNLLNVNTIKAICDNSKQKQNTRIDNYVVQSLEETVLNHDGVIYIVANKYFHEEICHQLHNFGKKRDDIFVVKEMIPLPDIISLCKEYVTMNV